MSVVLLMTCDISGPPQQVIAQTGTTATNEGINAHTADTSSSQPEHWYSWAETDSATRHLEQIPSPQGFARIPVEEASFGHWLRGLPLFTGRPEVLLFDGDSKWNQEAHFAVVMIDVGNRDLQQCADAVMRLRAEYLLATERYDQIAFHLTNGDLVRWADWSAGLRPSVNGNRVTWARSSASDSSRSTFRRYLDFVFTYAGSASLEAELETVNDPTHPEPGDVYIRGGFPGHAVIVVDVAEAANGERVVMLAQSYMPAQQVHVLRHPLDSSTPWYLAQSQGTLNTPEWTFQHTDLRRFSVTESTSE
ncbi:MAG: DUF4846 domain-containing protein [bacterium]|nr:DUF4846 domain-containing protein [bacterium]